MKVVSVVGARPQFIKCAPVSRELRRVATEVLVHTGQHYDDNMSGVFFAELGIPKPDYNLGVGSGLHGEQTAEMLKRIEGLLLSERPDHVLVYGDTNSTLAAALAAAKLRIPVAHVEAGLRSRNRAMPEEINRVLTDHVSALLFCPTPTAVKNLALEGLTAGVHLVGDVMYDALRANLAAAETHSTTLATLGLQPGSYFLGTVHRAANADRLENLHHIVGAFNDLADPAVPVVFPVHPRTRKLLAAARWDIGPAVRMIEPVSYLDMLVLEKNARAILTDSGGVQKEAYWLQVPCVTLRDETEWVETVDAGWNVLVGVDRSTIVERARQACPPPTPAATSPGDGASRRITDLLCAA
jgi:UDP-N-acetylglucosamine 2-epimerase (non-hydrolysing)